MGGGSSRGRCYSETPMYQVVKYVVSFFGRVGVIKMTVAAELLLRWSNSCFLSEKNQSLVIDAFKSRINSFILSHKGEGLIQ